MTKLLGIIPKYYARPSPASLATLSHSPLHPGVRNTIMFGDRAGGPDHYINGQVVTTPAASNGLGWGARANYIQLEGYLNDGLTSPGTRVMNANNDEFYSFHPQGGNFAFGDASVHFIRADIKATVFAALLTCKAGEALSVSDWE